MATKKTPEKKVPAKKPVAKKTPAKKTPAAKTAAPKTTRKPKLGPKELATAAKEPWVNVVTVELDPENVGNGAFELDWNEYFVARLVKAGYMRDKNDTDAEIVDRWFQEVCKNVVAENYEQWEANQPYDARPRNIDRRDLGDGRTEVS
jgi:hypothetical protein